MLKSIVRAPFVALWAPLAWAWSEVRAVRTHETVKKAARQPARFGWPRRRGPVSEALNDLFAELENVRS